MDVYRLPYTFTQELAAVVYHGQHEATILQLHMPRQFARAMDFATMRAAAVYASLASVASIVPEVQCTFPFLERICYWLPACFT